MGTIVKVHASDARIIHFSDDLRLVNHLAKSDMKLSFLSRATSLFGGLLLLFATPGWSAQTQVLAGHVPAIVKSLQPTGRLPGTNQLSLAIGLPLRNPAGLSKLLRQLYDPASPDYRHYLTPEEFTAQFGPTEEDYQKVTRFAQANGLTVTKTHGNRMLVDVSGRVSDVEKALHVTMRTYRPPGEARDFFAPDAEPSVDSSVPVLHVSGLDNYVLPRPLLHKMPASQAAPALGSGPIGGYMGGDFRNAYVPGTPLNGSGQMVGLLQFDSGFYQSDISTYESLAGLPNVPVQAVLLDNYGGGPGYGNDEVSLDIEMVISMAPGVSNIYVFEGDSTDDILEAMAASNQVKQLSASWSYPIDATSEQIFQQFAAQGQSFFNASGDYDAWLPGQIPTPCDDSNITIVGGTTLTMANNAWSSETVWNWGIEYGEDGIGSGGGISTTYTIPGWQTNINMTTNQGSATYRNIPDVALTGDNVFVEFGDGAQGVFGGTSCATPLWAGFMALVNQQAAATGKPPIGFANPAIYAIGGGANYTPAFHDITTGNNTWSGSPSQFYAVPGYDLCTGWGTPAGQSLINALVNPEALLITPATGFTSAGGSGGPFTVTSQSFSLTNAGTNSLGWTLANTSAWLNVSSAGGTLTPGGPAATVTVGLNSAASNLVAGIYNATVWFTNLNDNVGQGRPFTLSVISPPVITTQPANQVVLEGASAAFTVAAAGGLPLAYQWQDNGTNLTDGGNVSGSATTNLVISDVTSNNVGTYTVVVTNLAGAVTSSNAFLTITSSPPVVVTQPTNQTAVAGGTAAFSVTATGSTPLSFQWNFNGTNITGANNATLTLSNVQLTNAGNYAVTVTNLYGSVTSSNAVLTVLVAPPCDPDPSGLVAWWQGEGNAYDSIGTNNGTPVGGVTYTNGEVGRAFMLDNVNTTTSYIPLPASPSLNLGTSGGLTIECWIKPDAATLRGGAPIIEWDSATTDGLQLWIDLSANIKDTSGSSHSLAADGLVNSNSFQHVALTYDKNSGNAFLYYNGVAVATANIGNITPQTTYPVNIGRRTGQPIGNGSNYGGLIDELSLYNRALSSNEIAAIYNAGSEGKCPAPPTILVQPTNQTVSVGGTATFSVGASGSQPLFYQWSFNGTNISSATNTSLTLTNIQPVQAGTYAVQVANAGGSTNSANVTLTVNTPPGITTQPASSTNIVGSTAVFTVAAGGSTPLNYQWKENGTNIVGATSTNYTIVSVQTNNAGAYSVAITNAFGSVISSNAVLTVLAPPSITLQPASRTNLAGTTATFTNAATGTLPLSYQWRKNGSGMTDGGNVSGSATNLLTLASASDADAASYTVVVTNIAGSVTSSPAILVLLDPPAITTQPTNLTVTLTSNAIFSVTASGSPALSYQWRFNGTNIAWATNTSLTLTNVQLNQAGGYTVLVTNNYGSILSSNATLVVNPLLYFVWNQIPSPRFVAAPFAVVIQAQNPTNGMVTNFTGTVVLMSTNGVPVSPSVSGNFIQGVWTGAVTVAQTATNLVLQATDNLGDSGLANPINVISPPPLTAIPSSGILFIFWPVNPSGFVLETTTGLSPANWVPVAAPPLPIGNQYLLTIQMSGTNAFYRLRYTGQ